MAAKATKARRDVTARPSPATSWRSWRRCSRRRTILTCTLGSSWHWGRTWPKPGCRYSYNRVWGEIHVQLNWFKKSKLLWGKKTNRSQIFHHRRRLIRKPSIYTESRMAAAASWNHMAVTSISKRKKFFMAAEQCLNNTSSWILQHLQLCRDNVTHRTTPEVYLGVVGREWGSGGVGEWELTEARGPRGGGGGGGGVSSCSLALICAVGGEQAFITMWQDLLGSDVFPWDRTDGLSSWIQLRCWWSPRCTALCGDPLWWPPVVTPVVTPRPWFASWLLWCIPTRCTENRDLHHFCVCVACTSVHAGTVHE